MSAEPGLAWATSTVLLFACDFIDAAAIVDQSWHFEHAIAQDRYVTNPKLSASAMVLVLGLTSPCFAALGGTPTTHPSAEGSTTAVAHSMNAREETTHFTEVQTVLASGTMLSEYVGPDGVVFAVSWAGPFQPNLSALLGSSYPAFLDEATKHPRTARTMLSLNRSDIVISAVGHMRSYRGRAWLVKPRHLTSTWHGDPALPR